MNLIENRVRNTQAFFAERSLFQSIKFTRHHWFTLCFWRLSYFVCVSTLHKAVIGTVISEKRALRHCLLWPTWETDADFNILYSEIVQDLNAQGKLPWVQLMTVSYTISSEHQQMEQIHRNPLFRWFVGFIAYDVIWNHALSSKNPHCLQGGDISYRLLTQMLSLKKKRDILSKTHFCVDNKLINSLVLQKSCRCKGEDNQPGNKNRHQTIDFQEDKSCCDLLGPRADKSDGSKLAHLKHTLMENLHDLVNGPNVTQVTRIADRETDADIVDAFSRDQRITQRARKKYSTTVWCFVKNIRMTKLASHVAQNGIVCSPYIDGCTIRPIRHARYSTIQMTRRQIEERFDCIKIIGNIRKNWLLGHDRLNFRFIMRFAACNLIQMHNLGVV